MSRDPARELAEARRISRASNLLLKEKLVDEDRVSYIVYRILPDGRLTFVGKRGSPAGIRAFVARLARLARGIY